MLRSNPHLSVIHFHRIGAATGSDWLSQPLASLTSNLLNNHRATDMLPSLKKVILEPNIHFRDNLDQYNWNSIKASLRVLLQMFSGMTVEVWTGVRKNQQVGAMVNELNTCMKMRIPESPRIKYI